MIQKARFFPPGEHEERAISASKTRPSGKWKCDKLESFSDFLSSYRSPRRKAPFCYFELFSGPGFSACDSPDCRLEESALRVLRSPGPFSCFAFLAPNRKLAGQLGEAVKPLQTEGVRIFAGNPNREKVLLRVLDTAPRSGSGLAFIDPGGYRRLDWATLERLARFGRNWQGEKVDLLIAFPLEMALLRNLLRPECRNSVTRFYGNHQWEDIRRDKSVGKWSPEEVKKKLVEIYKAGLFGLGYRHVEDYRPASPTHEPYYHLIFASDTRSRLAELKSAWGKSRFLRCELLYGAGNKMKMRPGP